MMKKLYTLLALALISGSITAQTKKDGLKYSIKAGVNLSSIALSGSGVSQQNKDDIKTLTSYYFGANVEILVMESLYIQPGLALSGKGFKGTIPYKGTESGISYTARVTGTRKLMYLEVPINAIYKWKNFYFGAGGYGAYALSGKDDFVGTAEASGFTIPVERKKDLKLGNASTDDLEPWDLGANFLTGYQLNNGINFGLNYALGLAKKTTDKSNERQASNRVFSILMGYTF